MWTLAFDTCFGACSVAIGRCHGHGLVEDGRVEVMAAEYEARSSGHAEALVPMIERVVSEVRVQCDEPDFGLAKLDRIAVTHGPGSFTGVRTGVAAARGLALALSIPIVSVSSLSAIAVAARRLLGDSAAASDLMIAMGAGRGWIYVDMFGAGEVGHGDRVGPRAIADGDVVDLVGARGAAIAGTAAPAVAQLIRARGLSVHGCRDDVHPDARDILALTAGLNEDQLTLVPLYLRPPDAKLPAQSSLVRATNDTA